MPSPALFVVQVSASVASGDGGPTTVMLNLNRELRGLGVRSVIVTTDADGTQDRLPLPAGWPLEVEGGFVLSHRVHAPRRMKASIGAAWSIFRLARRADAIHVHGLYLFTSLVASFAGALWRTPVFLQPHGVLEPYQRRQSIRVKRVYDALGGRWALRHAAGVIFASTSEAEHASDLVPASQARIVPLGAAVGDVPSDYVAGWSGQVPADRPIVLFLGRVARKKRLDLLVAAWPTVAAALPCTLVVAGPYDQADRAACEPHGSREDIVWLGPVLGQDRDALLRRATVFVLPSENENFAIAVAEALVAGTPAIVTKEVAMSEVVERTGAGVVLPTVPTPAQLASTVLGVLSHPAELTLMRSRARMVAAPELSWQRTAHALAGHYGAARDGRTS